MSTRYVWGKYKASLSEESSKNGTTNLRIPSNDNLSDFTFCSQKPKLNTSGTAWYYEPAGFTKKVDLSSYNPGQYAGSNLGFTVAGYPYIVHAGRAYYYSVDTTNGYNVEYRIETEATSGQYVILGWNIAQQFSTYLYVKTAHHEETRGEFISYVSAISFSSYPTNGISSGYWYVYQGSDDIDPTGISYATTIEKGQKLSIRTTKSSSIKYGGTISYLYEHQANDGSWNANWYQSASLSITADFANAVAGGTHRYRVRAKDDIGFTSTTYATGPVCTVVGNYTVTTSASPSAGGSVSGGGSYASGASVTVTAYPNNGYSFSHWLEGSTRVSTNASYKFTVSGDRTLTAVFTAQGTNYTVTTSASPSAGGSVSSGGTFASGSSVTVIAVANSGYSFTGWYEGSILVSPSTAYTFTVTANRTLQARFSTQGASGSGTGHDAFFGVNDIAKKVSNIYIGVNGVARKVVKGFVGVDGVARLFYSFSGLGKWGSSELPLDIPWCGVAYGAGKFVAIGGHGTKSTNKAAYSIDGINWNMSTLPVYDYWEDIVYGSGKFVAIGSYGTIVYSTDGINWSDSSLGFATDKNWGKITYGNGMFVALTWNQGDSSSAYSPDGINWSESKISNLPWKNITFGNGVFVAVGYNNTSTKMMAYSIDGINWETSQAPVDARWSGICYGNGQFIAVSSGGASTYYGKKIARSKNGTVWSCSDSLPVNVGWRNVEYGNGMFVAIASSGSTGVARAAYSMDGISWMASDSLNKSGTWTDIAYGNGMFVAISSSEAKSAYVLW